VIQGVPFIDGIRENAAQPFPLHNISSSSVSFRSGYGRPASGAREAAGGGHAFKGDRPG